MEKQSLDKWTCKITFYNRRFSSQKLFLKKCVPMIEIWNVEFGPICVNNALVLDFKQNKSQYNFQFITTKRILRLVLFFIDNNENGVM